LKVVDGSDIDLVREAKYRIVVLVRHKKKNGIYKFINAVFFLFRHGIPATLLEEF
jgi:hypothetical protein